MRGAVNLIDDTGKGFFQPPLDKGDGNNQREKGGRGQGERVFYGYPCSVLSGSARVIL